MQKVVDMYISEHMTSDVAFIKQPWLNAQRCALPSLSTKLGAWPPATRQVCAVMSPESNKNLTFIARPEKFTQTKFKGEMEIYRDNSIDLRQSPTYN